MDIDTGKVVLEGPRPQRETREIDNVRSVVTNDDGSISVETDDEADLIEVGWDWRIREVYISWDPENPPLSPEQPDWMEVGTSQYDCGECGHSFLDRVFLYPDTDDEVVFLACPECGFTDRTPGEPTVESEWFHDRYSA